MQKTAPHNDTALLHLPKDIFFLYAFTALAFQGKMKLTLRIWCYTYLKDTSLLGEWHRSGHHCPAMRICVILG